MASYRIEWKSSAFHELKRLGRQIVPRIVEAVDSLSNDPFPSGARKLHGVEHTYRLRVGDYRVVYEALGNERLVTIIRVRHRREAYER